MKRLILLTAFALSTIGVFAQGTIIFANSSSTRVVWGSGAALSGTPVAAEYGIKVGLYYDNGSGFTLVSPTPYVGTAFSGATNAALNGRFNGGTVTVPGLVAGESGTFQVRAWSGTFNSYEAALAGGADAFGVSTTFTNPSGGVLDPVTQIPSPGASLSGFPGLTVSVPEPSVLFLAGLGLGILSLLSRSGSTSENSRQPSQEPALCLQAEPNRTRS